MYCSLDDSDQPDPDRPDSCMIIEAAAAIVSDLVRCSIHACIAPGWLESQESRVERRLSRSAQRQGGGGGGWMLFVLWSCGLSCVVGKSVGRVAVGSLDRWIVGGLAGWRKEGKKGSRFKYIELDNLGSARGCEDARSATLRACKDARIQTLRACKDWVSDRLLYRNHWDRIPQTAYSHGSLRP